MKRQADKPACRRGVYTYTEVYIEVYIHDRPVPAYENITDL